MPVAGQCHRKHTAPTQVGVRVKWQGKSLPAEERSTAHGKPHPEQDQIGGDDAARVATSRGYRSHQINGYHNRIWLTALPNVVPCRGGVERLAPAPNFQPHLRYKSRTRGVRNSRVRHILTGGDDIKPCVAGKVSCRDAILTGGNHILTSGSHIQPCGNVILACGRLIAASGNDKFAHVFISFDVGGIFLHAEMLFY